MNALNYPICTPYFDGTPVPSMFECIGARVIGTTIVAGFLAKPLSDALPPEIEVAWIVSALAVLACVLFARHPFAAYIEWLEHHIHFTPDGVRRSVPFVAPILLGVALAALWLLASLGPWYAVIFGCVCQATVILTPRLFGRAQRLYLLYRYYPDYVPGCWNFEPRCSVRARRLWIIVLGTSLACCLIGMNFGGPLGIALGLLGPSVLYVVHLPELIVLDRIDQQIDSHSFGATQAQRWERITTRLQQSEAMIDGLPERQHVYLGSTTEDTPLLYYYKGLEDFWWTAGATAQGKTALSVVPLIRQLIKIPHDEGSPAFLFIDLKGDRSAFHTLAEDAKQVGREFKFFSLESLGSSFDFLGQLTDSELQPGEFASYLLDATGADYGAGYGKDFFSGESHRALLQAIQLGGSARDFPSLYTAVKEKAPKNKELEVLSTLYRLAQVTQLGEGRTDQTIRMDSLLENSEMGYFFLDPSSGARSARDIARLALHALLEAAVARKRKGLPTRIVYVVIDEFQRVAGAYQMRALLALGRSFGLRFILANQSLQDLRHADDLLPVVQTNTGIKCFFSIDDLESAKSISLLSGEHIEELQSRTSDGKTTWSQVFRPNITYDDIRAVSNSRGWFMFQGRRLSRHTSNVGGGTVIAKALYCIEEEDHLARQDLPLPEQRASKSQEAPARWYDQPHTTVASQFGPAVWHGKLSSLKQALEEAGA